MKSKLTMKHRHLKKKVSLFISSITIVISCIFNIHKVYALSGTAYYHVYDWGSVSFGNFSQMSSNTTSNYLCIFDVQFAGVYDGTMNVNFSSTLPTGVMIEPFNCQISSVGTQSIQISYKNANQCYFLITAIANSNIGIQSLTYNHTKLCDGVPYLVERINSKMNDIKQYLLDQYNMLTDIYGAVDTVETKMQTLITTMSTISNNITSISSDINDINTYINGDLDTYIQSMVSSMNTSNNKLDTTNNKIDSLITAVNNINTQPSQSEINLITNFNNDIDVINNVETNLMVDLDTPILNNKKGYEYIDNYIVNKRVHQDAVSTLNIYNELTGPFGANLYIFEYISWYMIFVFVFALLGVIIG